MSKFSLVTFGCRCNQADSAALRHGLSRLSMTETAAPADADLIVVNTCTVTHGSDQQVRQTIRRLHRDNPGARLVITGCYAERDPDTLAAIPGVNMVLGNEERERLPELVRDLAAPGGEAIVVHPPLQSHLECSVPSMALTGGKTRPLVKVQDGCDNCCSYCIVPHVRGPGRSARPEPILEEIRSLVERGFQEIVITGINLGSYGRKIKGHARLYDLLTRIVEIPRIGRIRLSSIEPIWLEPSIIRLAAESPIFAHHFHVPLQSGSDRILRLMRRPYTAARVRELFRTIDEEIPDVALGTDVLVGFPGETAQDFEETCRLIEDSPLAYLHIFPFSPREGTEAFSLPDRVPPEIVKERMGRLLAMSKSKNLAFRRRFTGKVLPAITLSNQEEMGESTVLTGNYIEARVPGLTVPPNTLVDIRIEDVQPGSTRAVLQ